MRKSLKRTWRKKIKRKNKKRKKKRHSRVVMTKRVKEIPTTIVAQIVEYDALFGEENRPFIVDILQVVPRDKVIRLASILAEFYERAGEEKLEYFFSPHSYRNRVLVGTLIEKYKQKLSADQTYYWTSPEIPQQLLRHAFAIPTETINKKELSEEDAELLIFKAILLLNQEQAKYKIREEMMTAYNMSFLLSVLNKDMHGEDEKAIKDRSIMQLYFSVQFFLMLESQVEYKPFLEAFKEKYRINDWNEYIRSVFALLAINQYKPTIIPGDLRNDKNHLVNKVVLDKISLPWDDYVKFYSDGPEDREGNTDYKKFRAKPLIRLKNGDYAFISWEFVVDRLFNSLYFDFKELNVSKKLLGKVNGLFTEKFAEKHLFNHLLEMSVSEKKYHTITENQMKENCSKATKKIGELGPPDYLIQNDTSCIIFECKDVRIGGDELQTHDFDIIIDIFSNKLYQKKWHYKNGVKEYFPIDKDRRIGITQLTDHIMNIRAGRFKYTNVDSHKRIYPVLIISDYKNVHKGFSHIANNWYRKSLDKLNAKSEKNRPLIVMSFITLLKYHDLFTKYGFETYFEDYYKLMFSPYHNKEEALTVNMSFDDFMGRHNYDLTPMVKMLNNIMSRGVKENRKKAEVTA